MIGRVRLDEVMYAKAFQEFVHEDVPLGKVENVKEKLLELQQAKNS
eukprot:COSAG04_NODE_17490_length_468_cov_0.756098_2_plen_45_part_01